LSMINAVRDSVKLVKDKEIELVIKCTKREENHFQVC